MRFRKTLNRPALLALLASTALFAPSLLAQDDSPEARIQTFYRQYYQRTPTNPEVEGWMQWSRKGNSIDEIQAGFAGSDEFFNRHQRDVIAWLEALNQIVGQPAGSDQIARQRTRLGQLGGDRSRLALEIITGALSQTSPPQTPLDPDQNEADAPITIHTFTGPLQRLGAAVNQEVHGADREALRAQVNVLNNLTRSNHQVISAPHKAPLQAQKWAEAMGTALREAKRRAAHLDPQSQTLVELRLLERQVRLFGWQIPADNPQTIRALESTRVADPQLPRTTSSDVQELARSYEEQIGNARFALNGTNLDRDGRRQLTDELERLKDDASELRRSLRQDPTHASVQRDLSAIQARVARLDRVFDSYGTRVGSLDAWKSSTQTLTQLQSALGPPSDSLLADELPTGEFQGGLAVRQLQQAARQCRQLESQLEALQTEGVSVTLALDDLRVLKQSIEQLTRSIPSSSHGEDVLEEARQVNKDLAQLLKTWSKIRQPKATQPMPNPAGLTRSLDRAQQLLGLTTLEPQ